MNRVRALWWRWCLIVNESICFISSKRWSQIKNFICRLGMDRWIDLGLDLTPSTSGGLFLLKWRTTKLLKGKFLFFWYATKQTTSLSRPYVPPFVICCLIQSSSNISLFSRGFPLSLGHKIVQNILACYSILDYLRLSSPTILSIYQSSRRAGSREANLVRARI